MNVYELILEDETLQGVDCISVVGRPAMESKAVFLKEQSKKINFVKIDNEKQIILGIAMIPEKNIYRFDEESKEEFEVYFSKDTVKRISELYLKKGNQLNANLEHNENQKIDAVIVESWIVEDTEKDKTSLYELDAPLGSWVVAMKIEDKDQWELAKETGTGFSIEGLFSEKLINKNQNMNIKEVAKELFSEIKQLLNSEAPTVEQEQKVVLEEKNTITDLSGNELAVSWDNFAENEKIWGSEDRQPLATGTYMYDATTEFDVETGVITAIRRVDKPDDETVETFNDDILNALKSLLQLSKQNEKEISEIKLSMLSEIESLKLELSKPAVESLVVAPVEKEVKLATTSRGRLLDSINNLKK